MGTTLAVILNTPSSSTSTPLTALVRVTDRARDVVADEMRVDVEVGVGEQAEIAVPAAVEVERVSVPADEPRVLAHSARQVAVCKDTCTQSLSTRTWRSPCGRSEGNFWGSMPAWCRWDISLCSCRRPRRWTAEETMAPRVEEVMVLLVVAAMAPPVEEAMAPRVEEAMERQVEEAMEPRVVAAMAPQVEEAMAQQAVAVAVASKLVAAAMIAVVAAASKPVVAAMNVVVAAASRQKECDPVQQHVPVAGRNGKTPLLG
uniref:Uncharacterized protein n=2 Tax=Leersia perrieri TaxID=77586 RepID=A0A0D9WJG3_9ORYZ